MKHTIAFIILLFSVVILAGCADRQSNDISLVTKDIKAAELVPKQSLERRQYLNIGLGIYLFQMPRQNYPVFAEQFVKAQKLPFKYLSQSVFSFNGFATAGGDILTWRILSKALAGLDAKAIKIISLQILESMSDDVVIKELPQGADTYYIGTENIVSNINLSPGRIILRFKPQPMIGLRRATGLDVKTIYQLAGADRKVADEITYNNLGFDVRLGPGQFFIIGPVPTERMEKYLGDLMFSSDWPVPVVRFCLIVCNSISE